MNLKFFILGLYVLVLIAQISTAQQLQEEPSENESEDDDGEDESEGDAPDEENEPEDQGDEEIEQRRKITSVLNSAVNVVEPQETQQQHVYTQMQSSNTGYIAPVVPSAPAIGPPIAVGRPVGGLLKTLYALGASLLPALKPLWKSIIIALPMVESLLGPMFSIIMKALPLLPKIIESVKPLLGLVANFARYLPKLLECLQTAFHLSLNGMKFLLNGLKKLYALLPVLPHILELIPNVIHALWRVWHSIRYVLLYPVRSFGRWLLRIQHLLFGVPRYLESILHAIGYYLFTPVRIIGHLIRTQFGIFNDFVIEPVAKLKYFLANLFDVLLGPLHIVRHFLEELACFFIKTPIRVVRSLMRAFFVDGILNTIRYIKTVLFEIISLPWSYHYADMFPSLGNRHNYILPRQIVCQGSVC